VATELTRRQLIWLLGGAAAGAAVGGVLSGRDDVRRLGHHVRFRPPGALDEDDFLAACIRCGQCVEACPSDVLSLTTLSDGVAAATPYMRPGRRPCTLCVDEDSMQCISICPTPALAQLASRRDVRIGVAVIDESICRPWRGRGCPRPCYTQCPFPDEAIVLVNPRRRPVVDAERCVGCGICERLCPTNPPSIVVEHLPEKPRGAEA
jgi:ferredoxin-type protein NapG